MANKSFPVFRIQLAQFKREKGVMIFYGFCILVIGIVVPFFTRTVETPLAIASFLTALFLRPVLADSLAGEREHNT